MEDMVIRILGMAAWFVVVGFIMRSLYLTGRSADRLAAADANLIEERAGQDEGAYVLCYERCMNDAFGNPDRVSLCRASCAI